MLVAGWTLEGQFVYLFCIILANRKTPAEAQGTHQIWVPVTGNFTKYCACSSHNICFCCLGMVVYFMKVIFLQTKHEARYFVIGKWHIGKVGNQDWAIAKKILCPDCQEAARRSHTGGELVRDVWNRVFALAHTHCSNCAHTVCRVPTSPILGPASRCRHFVSRCPTALLLRYRVWHIVFHHMVISLHIVSTLMTHSTPSQIAKWLRITHADLTLYWENFWHMKKTRIGRLSFLVSRARLDWEAVPWKMINFVQAWHSVHTK